MASAGIGCAAAAERPGPPQTASAINYVLVILMSALWNA